MAVVRSVYEIHYMSEKKMEKTYIFGEDGRNSPTVEYIPEMIYPDDTIETLKWKIRKYCNILPESKDTEIYLYGKKEVDVDIYGIYNALTLGGKSKLHRRMLSYFLLNNSVSRDEVSKLEDKDFSVTDIAALIKGKKMLELFSIGQRLDTSHRNQYLINPFDLIELELVFKNTKDIIHLNNNLIMNEVPQVNGRTEIYMCLREDVIKFKIKDKIDVGHITKTYFYTPRSTISRVDDTVMIANNKVIQGFYESYTEGQSKHKKTHTLEPLKINYINFTIFQHIMKLVPLDTIFRLIHASKMYPVIKFNTSRKTENLYRLYADKISTTGKRLPYSESAGLVKKLAGDKNKNENVSVYISHESKKIDAQVVCKFDLNGYIVVDVKFSHSVIIENANAIISELINPVFDFIRIFLEKNGYAMKLFKGIEDDNTEINHTTCVYTFKTDTHSRLNPLPRELDVAFATSKLINDNLLITRFKKISNYITPESDIEAFINDIFDEDKTDASIIDELVKHFGYSIEVCTLALSEFKRNRETISKRSADIDFLKNNPGFLTTISKGVGDNTIDVTIENVNNKNYLNTLPVYVTAIQANINKHTVSIKPLAIDTPVAKKPIAKKNAKKLIIESPEESPEESPIVAPPIVAPPIVAPPIVGQSNDDDELDRLMQELMQEGGDESYGGSGKTKSTPKALPEYDHDIKLGYPNILQTRMEKVDPQIKHKDYSSKCQWHDRRMPIVIDQEQKEAIDKKDASLPVVAKSYRGSLQYNTDPTSKKKLYYICPRYWDIANQRSLTDSEAKSGNYGNIIPEVDLEGRGRIKKGDNILELNGKYHKNGKKGNASYTYLTPGFLKSNEEGVCLPCCFKGQTKNTIEMQKKCAPPEARLAETDTGPISKINTSHIIGADRYPIQPNQRGFLPEPIQNLLQPNKKQCNNVFNDMPNQTCLVRFGVEQSTTQSFIACIASIYAFINTPGIESKKVPTITQFKKQLSAAINEERFKALQNGNLINIFAPKEDVGSKSLTFEEKVSLSFKNFLNFLKDDQIVIDYKYLWDAICTPNPELFKDGLNMVILESTNANVNVLCPTNHYSPNLFDPSRGTIVISMHKSSDGKYIVFEPIYKLYKNKLSAIFGLDFGQDIDKPLLLIVSALKDKCLPVQELTGINATQYTFKRNMVLAILLYELDLILYKILFQVMNNDGQIIGVIAENNGVKNNNNSGYVPCAPSAYIPSIKIIMSTDHKKLLKWTMSYKDTRRFLNHIYLKSGEKIPCRPYKRVIEQNILIGIVTITNQFVDVTPEEIGGDIVKKNIEGEKDEPELSVFRIDDMMDSNDVDETRTSYIRDTKLETDFYVAFRNIIKIFLNSISNKRILDTILDIKKNKDRYLVKMRELIALIKSNISPHISFKPIIPNDSDIRNCSTLSAGKCGANKNCEVINNACINIFPMKNLIDPTKENEKIYYAKIADEILRYEYISNFLTNPNSFMLLTNVDYNLNEDEIILQQSVIVGDYLKGEIASDQNKYIKNNTRDTAIPENQSKESAEIQADFNLKNNFLPNTDCIVSSGKGAGDKPDRLNFLILSIKTKFNNDIIVVKYGDNTSQCTFNLIMTLIKNVQMSYDDVKRLLNNLYNDEFGVNKIAVKEALSSNKPLTKLKDIKDIVLADGYKANITDYWLIARHYQIPIVFLLGDITAKKNKFIVTRPRESSPGFYYFLSVAGSSFSLLLNHKKEKLGNPGSNDEQNPHKIKETDLDEEFKKEINEYNLPETLEEFLNLKLH